MTNRNNKRLLLEPLQSTKRFKNKICQCSLPYFPIVSCVGIVYSTIHYGIDINI